MDALWWHGRLDQRRLSMLRLAFLKSVDCHKCRPYQGERFIKAVLQLILPAKPRANVILAVMINRYYDVRGRTQ